MINRRNYAVLAGVTFVLFLVNGAIGSDHDVLWVLDDVLFFGFLLCAVLLIAMTVAILVKAATGKKSTV